MEDKEGVQEGNCRCLSKEGSQQLNDVQRNVLWLRAKLVNEFGSLLELLVV